MNKIEKMEIKTEMIKRAYEGAISYINWEYCTYVEGTYEPPLKEEGNENYEKYEYAKTILTEIEDLLTVTKK